MHTPLIMDTIPRLTLMGQTGLYFFASSRMSRGSGNWKSEEIEWKELIASTKRIYFFSVYPF